MQRSAQPLWKKKGGVSWLSGGGGCRKNCGIANERPDPVSTPKKQFFPIGKMTIQTLMVGECLSLQPFNQKGSEPSSTANHGMDAGLINGGEETEWRERERQRQC